MQEPRTPQRGTDARKGASARSLDLPEDALARLDAELRTVLELVVASDWPFLKQRTGLEHGVAREQALSLFVELAPLHESPDELRRALEALGLDVEPAWYDELAEGFDAGDSPRLAGMDERKGGFWGGASATWRNPVAPLTLEWLADLSGHSKGSKLQLQADHRFGFGALSLTLRVQLQWLDRKYVDYYFGVRAHEVTADRAAYAGAAALAVEAGLRVDYALAARHAVFLDLSRTQLPDEIKRSPIVDRQATSRAAFGYLYRF